MGGLGAAFTHLQAIMIMCKEYYDIHLMNYKVTRYNNV